MSASSLPDPVVRYRQVPWAAGLGCLTSLVGAFALPVEPWASVSLAGPCVGLALYARWRVGVWSRERRNLGRWEILHWRADDERPKEGIYLGHAFALDQSHAQRLANLMSEPWSTILSGDAQQRALPGHPRPWGVVRHRHAHTIFRLRPCNAWCSL